MYNPIQGVTAVIDYAHTPDALQNVLKTIDQIRKADEQVITVIGAGGNRDKTKRPIMAKVAADMSDRLILTSDNPRNEEPVDIINDMKAGLDNDHAGKTIIQPDRREAIKTACMLAQKGDIILIAGKGHETYQEIKGIKHHFSDLEVVASLFELKQDQSLTKAYAVLSCLNIWTNLTSPGQGCSITFHSGRPWPLSPP